MKKTKRINKTEGMEESNYLNEEEEEEEEEEESIIAIAKHTRTKSSLMYVHTNTYLYNFGKNYTYTYHVCILLGKLYVVFFISKYTPNLCFFFRRVSLGTPPPHTIWNREKERKKERKIY